MKQKNVREYQRAECIVLRKTGASYRTIGTILGISRASVQRALERFEEIGSYQDRHRCGRPKKVNGQNGHILKDLTQDSVSRSSACKAMMQLNESLEKSICRRTFINYLEECNFEYEVKIKKPCLNKKHKEARLQWCSEHLNWTVDDWKQVLFSHESTFYIIESSSGEFIRHIEDEKTKQCSMWVNGRGESLRVGFWGIITWKGTGCCAIYRENINSDVYCDILDNYLVPTIHINSMEHNFIFQHDNASFCRSKQTQAKLRELNARVLKWPIKSPDLNPIEHLFSIINSRLRTRKILSLKELIDNLSSEWSSIPSQLCENLVFSMPQRIQKCLAEYGNSIDC
ncbi:unnamed protein product [Rotaria magnacalcarata]